MILKIDENGNTIDYLKERNEEIKDKLRDFANTIYAEKKYNPRGRYGYRFAINMDACFRSYGLMTATEYANLTAQDIEDYWQYFLDLLAYYNQYIEIIIYKQLFCSYMRINLSQFSRLEKSADEDIRNLMLAINDSFIGLGFAAAESGGASAGATKLRLGAVEVGHGVVSATDEMLVNAVNDTKTPLEVERALKAIVGDSTPTKRLKP